MTNRIVTLSWADVQAAADDVASVLRPELDRFDSVAGVPRGGIVPAVLVASALGLPVVALADATQRTVVVDDLIDSGATLDRITAERGMSFGYVAFLYRKSTSPATATGRELDGWLAFPWEAEDESAGPTDAVRRLLEHVGEDPNRDGLLDTPARVVKSLSEMTTGYDEDPAVILERTFDVGCDEMVVVPGIHFTSLCEHHLLPFVGTAIVGYVPGDRVVGLSKLPRLVEAFARRLQVQERMTSQIAGAIDKHLAPLGVGVVLRAHHSCMSCRGVRQTSAQMVTSATLGLFRDDPRARAEFLALAYGSTTSP